MTIVSIKIDQTERYDLESAKPDGFVVLRRFTYGEVVKRRSLTKMSMNMEKGNKDFKGEMALASTEINNFDFAIAIVEHNLEKAEGVKFNFKIPSDLQFLDPKVGEEIEVLIAKLNDLSEDVGE